MPISQAPPGRHGGRDRSRRACDDAGVARFLCAMWAGGGNVGPFVCLAERLQARGHEVAAVATPSLAERLAGAGIEMHASPDGWLPSGDDLTQAIGSYRPDVVIVDYMLTDALGHGEAGH
jgi:hypothetical protein